MIKKHAEGLIWYPVKEINMKDVSVRGESNTIVFIFVILFHHPERKVLCFCICLSTLVNVAGCGGLIN